MEKIREVYSLLMPLQGARVVLPRAAVAEVTGYAKPKNRPDDAPDFLLGFIDWQGQQIPLVSFELACGRDAPEQGRRARIAVVFGIGGLLEPNAFAVLTQGYPYLVRVNEGVLKQEDLTEQDMKGPILARVRMANERPLIPDIETLEQMLADALGDRAKAPEPAVSDTAASDELDQLDVGEEEDFEAGMLDDGSTAARASDMADELESLVQESKEDLAEIAEVASGDDTDSDEGVTTADLGLPEETDSPEEASGDTDYSSELQELDQALEDSDEDDSSSGDFGIDTGEIGDFEFSEGSGETDYSGELDDISGALEDTEYGENAASSVEGPAEDPDEAPEAGRKQEADTSGADTEDDDDASEEKEEFSLDDIEFELDDDEESPDKED